ncbi:unnamed protein product, partial [marine sediment metagenome]
WFSTSRRAPDPHPLTPSPDSGEGAGDGGNRFQEDEAPGSSSWNVEPGTPNPLRGIGIASTIEVSAQGWESGRIEVAADGTIIARTGSSSHGQGHETSFAQVVADHLEVPFEAVRIVHGDTTQTPEGVGTFGSRSMALGGGALAVSAEGVKHKALQVAAALLETSMGDLVYAQGGVQVVGAPERRVSLAELARAAEQGLG